MPPRRMPAAPLTDREKASLPKITLAFLKRILSYLRPYALLLLASFALIILSSVLNLYPSIITGKMIDIGLYQRDFNVLVRLAIYSLGILIVACLLGVLRTYITNYVAHHIVFDMRSQMFSHLQRMPQSFFTSNKQGDIVTRMTGDISGVQSVITTVFTGTVMHIITIVVTLVALFRISWVLALCGLLIAPLAAIPTQIVGKKRWKYAFELQAKHDTANQIINEDLSVSGQQLVKLFVKEDFENSKYNSINKEITDLTIKENLVGRWFGALMRLMSGIAPVIIYLIGGFLMLKGGHTDLSVGDISVIVALMARLYAPVESLMSTHINLTRSFALFSRIFEYFDMDTVIKDPESPLDPAEFHGKISFKDVSFSYTEGKEVLSGISFDVAPGKMVALVGPSGAGKTTISSLITRLYDIQSGDILIDGNSIKDLSLNYLRSNIGMVAQETYLFNATIKENLKFANENATDAEIEEACRKADIHDYIVSLPDGYDTLVGARGFKLSGGERQRVSIARMILKNPKVLIMDEATSSLDSISEKYIQDAIHPLLKGRTSIVIAHRLSTIMEADEILVLDNGKIVERGTHTDLLASNNGVYKELYETQFMKNAK